MYNIKSTKALSLFSFLLCNDLGGVPVKSAATPVLMVSCMAPVFSSFVELLLHRLGGLGLSWFMAFATSCQLHAYAPDRHMGCCASTGPSWWFWCCLVGY
jgi:hypothetical protein